MTELSKDVKRDLEDMKEHAMNMEYFKNLAKKEKEVKPDKEVKVKIEDVIFNADEILLLTGFLSKFGFVQYLPIPYGKCFMYFVPSSEYYNNRVFMKMYKSIKEYYKTIEFFD